MKELGTHAAFIKDIKERLDRSDHGLQEQFRGVDKKIDSIRKTVECLKTAQNIQLGKNTILKALWIAFAGSVGGSIVWLVQHFSLNS